MGVAREVFRWHHIGAHAKVGLFLHGYGTRQFFAHAIVPELASNVPSGAVQVKAQLEVGETSVHYGTIARTLIVENRSVGPQPFIAVSLFDFVEDVR